MSDLKSPRSWHDFLGLSFLILALVILFSKSFDPGWYLFANDLPLGALSAESAQLPLALKGWWSDVNWIGIEIPLSLNITTLFRWVLGPIGYVKFGVPLSLLFLGCCAYYFFRQIGLTRKLAGVGALAAGLNMHWVSVACWGLWQWTLMAGLAFLCMGLVMRRDGASPWLRLALAGLALGLAVTEGFDSGAIVSVFVGLFVVVETWVMPTPTTSPNRRFFLGVARAALVAMFAVYIATQTLVSLVSTQVQGVVGMDQDAASRKMRWQQATQWSLPKAETIRILIPGVTGYGMYTSGGGRYWGRVGETPGAPGSRFSGSGEYAGLLVLFVAALGVFQSMRGPGSPFSASEKKLLWFWTAATLVTLVLSWGRYAIFYQIVYALPYFSTIRNPIKFLHPFHITLLVMFGYGLLALQRTYLSGSASGKDLGLAKLWKTKASFEKRFVQGMIGFVVLSLLGAFIYFGKESEVLSYLRQFEAEESLALLVKFSQHEVLIFLCFLLACTALIAVTLAGWFSGKSGFRFVLLASLLLAFDLGHSNRPWIRYENGTAKFAPNPVMEFLKKQQPEGRVTMRYAPTYQAFFSQDRQVWPAIAKDWLENIFLINNIQSIDISQMPRQPEIESAYLSAFAPTENNLRLPGRLWELTNTRYVIGSTNYLTPLDENFSRKPGGFKIVERFHIEPAPGKEVRGVEDLVFRQAADGTYAIFEYLHALPRAVLYTQWETHSDPQAVISRIRDESWDPKKSVVLLDGNPPLAPLTNSPAGIPAKIENYSPHSYDLRVEAIQRSVLLVNDRWHPNWKVTIDGKPAPLLRANFAMRGVEIPSGIHQVRFYYDPPHRSAWISLSAVVLGLGLSVGMLVARRGKKSATPVNS